MCMIENGQREKGEKLNLKLKVKKRLDDFLGFTQICAGDATRCIIYNALY